MTQQDKECVLEFELADLVQVSNADTKLDEVQLKLHAGELALVEVRRGVHELPLADSAVGLARPSKGAVRFLGEDWQTMTPTAAHSARHQIGRVFTEPEWVSNLNVDENILLGACHHTHRKEESIIEEALELARRFGLDEIPSKRQHQVSKHKLRALALVRAFLDSPRLILLDCPLRGVVSALANPLMELVSEVCEAGTSVLWITPEETVLHSKTLLSNHRFVAEPPTMRAQEEARS